MAVKWRQGLGRVRGDKLLAQKFSSNFMRLFQVHSSLIEVMTISNHLTKNHHANDAVGLISQNATKPGRLFPLSNHSKIMS